MESKKYITIGTIPKSNIKIVPIESDIMIIFKMHTIQSGVHG